jgi:serine/threonine-protein kinase
MVTDFGIAKALTASRTDAGGDTATLTQAGGSIGTPAYMAPEQAVGEVVDHRADLYAWGVMAYELLAGVHPFRRHSTPQQLVAAHLTEVPSPIGGANPEVAAPLAAVVMQCLEKDPARRPASAAAVLHALDAVGTPSAPIAAPVIQPRRRLLAVIVAAAVLVGGTLAVWLSRPAGGPPPASAADRSLAVLPLANLSGDKDDDYFGIGLAEEITRALAKNGVRVIGRTSAAALQAKGLDDRAIARELQVASLLTGTVQRAEGQVRITVALLSAGDGQVRWTEKYDRPLANVFAVQDEIARAVADTLLGTLGRSSAAAPARAETADPDAHALYLQGLVLFNRRGARNLQQAIALFQRAAARDPQYARARASAAMALAVLPAYVVDSTTPLVTRAVAEADRAIAMDSTIPESYAALGYGYSLLGELDRAETSFRRALALDSTVASTWGWYGLLANRLGDYAAAHERIARGLALEPASLIARIWEAQVLHLERRYAEADSLSSATMALDSTFMLAWTWRANALLAMGRTGEAIDLLQRRLAATPTGRPEEPHGMLAYAYARAGRTAEARALLDSLPPTGAAAAALEELGDHRAAMEVLERATTAHDVWLVQFPRMERYDKLRGDPRAAALLDRLGTK